MFARKKVRDLVTHFAIFAIIFIREHFYVYGTLFILEITVSLNTTVFLKINMSCGGFLSMFLTWKES